MVQSFKPADQIHYTRCRVMMMLRRAWPVVCDPDDCSTRMNAPALFPRMSWRCRDVGHDPRTYPSAIARRREEASSPVDARDRLQINPRHVQPGQPCCHDRRSIWCRRMDGQSIRAARCGPSDGRSDDGSLAPSKGLWGWGTNRHEIDVLEVGTEVPTAAHDGNAAPRR